MQFRQVFLSEPGSVVSFDSLPVFQLTVFSAPLGYDLPFIQARAYAEQGRSLFLKLTAYEATAPEDSRFALELGKLALEISPNHSRLSLNGEPLEHAAVRVTPVRGEDLQGEFWGAIVQIPLAALRMAFPALSLQPDERIPCSLVQSRDSTGRTASLFDGDGSLVLAAF